MRLNQRLTQMKIKIRILLLALLSITTLASLFAEVDEDLPIEQQSHVKKSMYFLESEAPENPVVISLTVGSLLCIGGDQQVEVVGGNEIKNPGCRYFDGVHIVKYEGGIGAKEGTKTTYNFSLWSFEKSDYETSVESQSNTPLKIKKIHNIRGLWEFRAINPTPKNAPQELTFTNKDGSVVTIQVTVTGAE